MLERNRNYYMICIADRVLKGGELLAQNKGGREDEKLV